MNEAQAYHLWLQKLSNDRGPIFAGTLLHRASQLFPDRTALITNAGQSIDYQALYKESCKVSVYLNKHGITAGDRVLLLADNSIFFYLAYFGIWQTGAVIAPLNTFLHPHELEHIITDIQAKALIVSDSLANKISSITVPLPPLITQTELENIENPSTTNDFQPHERPPDELAALLYTSGTTGLPKGVMLSSRNIISNIAQGLSRFQFINQERVFCALPLFHSFAQNTCVWSSFAAGAAVILLPKITRQTLLEGLALKPTIVLGIPGLYGLFCRFPNISFSHVRYLICGGDALPDKIRMYFALVFNRKLCNGYGLTETSPFISVDLDDVVTTTHTVGYPVPEVSCEIRTEDLRSDDPKTQDSEAQIGILWVKGPNIMLGYYNAPEATQAILHDGWLNTGDLAYRDPRGKIVIAGREKDLIKNKGIKIYPQEIETVLLSHPLVMYTAVIGMRLNEHEEEYPIAYLTLKEPLAQAEHVLQQFCVQHLAPYKIPRQYIIRDSLPLTATGKVDKKALKNTAKSS